MLRQSNLTLQDIKPIRLDGENINFPSADIDIISGHEAGEVLTYSLNHIFVRTFAPTFGGKPIFADTLVTNEQTIRSMPEVVRAMSQAVAAGWDMVSTNPTRGLNATCSMMSDFSKANRKHQLASQNHMIGLRGGSRSEGPSVTLSPFGLANEDWIPIISAMKDAGLIETEINPSDLYWQ